MCREFLFSIIFFPSFYVLAWNFKAVDILSSTWFSFKKHINIRSPIECAAMCNMVENCTAFLHNDNAATCQFGSRGRTKVALANSSSSQIARVFVKPGFYKIMVVTGYSNHLGIPLNSFEIIDLESTTTVCNPFPNYPISARATAGGLIDGETPLVCGGIISNSGSNLCYTYKNGGWISAPSMTEARYHFMGVPNSPFQNQSQKFFVTGGYTSLTGEIFDGTRWSKSQLPQLKMTVYASCLTYVGANSIMIVGGWQGGYQQGVNTYTLSSLKSGWVQGPSLNTGRFAHGCGQILTSAGSTKYSTVAVGGFANGFVSMQSVEILDGGASAWRAGPTLPLATGATVLVNDPWGGVILIGGTKIEANLYQLRNLQSSWELMIQKMGVGRVWLNAFLIPDEIVNCK